MAMDNRIREKKRVVAKEHHHQVAFWLWASLSWAVFIAALCYHVRVQ